MWGGHGGSLEGLKAAGGARGLSHNLPGVSEVMGCWESVWGLWNGGVRSLSIFV